MGGKYPFDLKLYWFPKVALFWTSWNATIAQRIRNIYSTARKRSRNFNFIHGNENE